MVDDIAREYFQSTIARDTWSILCGDRLGFGVARTVFACRLNPDYVLKIETGGRSFQNVLEWETWKIAEYAPKQALWLAPCISISTCGTVLVQRRTTPARAAEMPKSVPNWLTDVKLDNWGILDGRPVCHDYGYPNNLIAWRQGRQKVVWEQPRV